MLMCIMHYCLRGWGFRHDCSERGVSSFKRHGGIRGSGVGDSVVRGSGVGGSVVRGSVLRCIGVRGSGVTFK